MLLITPGTVLLIVAAIVAAQVTRVVAPRTTPYIVVLALAAAGILGAEALVGVLHHGGPSVGVLHPLADVLAVAVVEAVGLAVWSPRGTTTI